MNPHLGAGRGLLLDEKVAVSVALALGIPLVLGLFWLGGFSPWAGADADPARRVTGAGEKGLLSEGGGAASTREGSRSSADSGDAGGGPAPEQETARDDLSKRNQELEAEKNRMAARLADLELELARKGSKVPSSAGKAELESLKGEHERFRQENETLSQEVFGLRDEFAGAKLLHAKLIRDSQAREQRQSALIAELQGDLQRSESEKGSLMTEVERLQTEVDRVHKLEEDLRKLQGLVEGERKKARELEDSLRRSREEMETLQGRMDAADVQKGGDPEKLEALTKANAALQSEVEELRAMLQQIPPAPQARMPVPGAAGKVLEEDRLRTLEAENKRLQAELKAAMDKRPPIRAKVIESRPSTVQTPAQGPSQPAGLGEGSGALYDFLQKAVKEELSITERDEAARSRNVGQLVARLNFGEGRYAVDPKEEIKLESLLSQQDDGGSFLVVGYASLPGCTRQNEVLSRRRAEAVSEAAKKYLKPGGRLQTVYFGETDQFDSEREENNQIVEVWRVGP